MMNAAWLGKGHACSEPVSLHRMCSVFIPLEVAATGTQRTPPHRRAPPHNPPPSQSGVVSTSTAGPRRLCEAP